MEKWSLIKNKNGDKYSQCYWDKNSIYTVYIHEMIFSQPKYS